VTSKTEELLGQEVDTYVDTVKALMAFILEFMWDGAQIREDAVHEHGVAQAYDDGDGRVTPDIAIRFPGEAGAVGEVKASFGGGGRDADKIRDVLAKYDGVAARWRGEAGQPASVSDSCVALLTDITRETDASDYFKAELEAGRFKPKGKFGLVSYVRRDQKTKVYYVLKRHYGELSPPEFDERLRKVKSIWIEEIESRYAYVKFYDANPPLTYMLTVLWDMLPSTVAEEEFKTRAGGGARPTISSKVNIPCDVDTIAATLRDSFSLRRLSPRLPECPKKAFVRTALEKLRELGLAERQGADNYLVGWRALRGGTQEYFLSKIAAEIDGAASGPDRDGSQMELGLGGAT